MLFVDLLICRFVEWSYLTKSEPFIIPPIHLFCFILFKSRRLSDFHKIHCPATVFLILIH